MKRNIFDRLTDYMAFSDHGFLVVTGIFTFAYFVLCWFEFESHSDAIVVGILFGFMVGPVAAFIFGVICHLLSWVVDACRRVMSRRTARRKP
jgi:hypothetical protein